MSCALKTLAHHLSIPSIACAVKKLKKWPVAWQWRELHNNASLAPRHEMTWTFMISMWKVVTASHRSCLLVSLLFLVWLKMDVAAVLRVQRSTGWAKSEITASRLAQMAFLAQIWDFGTGHAASPTDERNAFQWHCGADHIAVAGPGGQNGSSST